MTSSNFERLLKDLARSERELERYKQWVIALADLTDDWEVLCDCGRLDDEENHREECFTTKIRRDVKWLFRKNKKNDV